MPDIKRSEIRQYLTFMLAGEVYALSVASIKEVLSVPKLTKVPRMPPFMKGIINLRGSVVPVLDLCTKFGIGETALTADTSIIVTEIQNPRADGGRETLVVGIFSDMVQKVTTIEPDDIEPPPKIGSSISNDFIQGMGHIDGNFIIILDIDRILSGAEVREIQSDAALEPSAQEPSAPGPAT